MHETANHYFVYQNKMFDVAESRYFIVRKLKRYAGLSATKNDIYRNSCLACA